MKPILHAINVSRNPMFRAATDLMTEIITVSRLSYRPDLIPMKSVCPMPTLPSSFQISFSEICLERGEALWKNCGTARFISVLWSGGIDSTVTLAALLRTAPAGYEVHVYCNLNSIVENPVFYTHLLSLKNVIFKNSSIVPDSVPIHFISGELGDQIFGSDLLFRIAGLFGFEKLQSPYQEVIPQLFRRRSGEQHGAELYERYRPIVDEAPFAIKTSFDFIWWWNFTQKWQCVKYRKESLLNEMHKVSHFFESENFQLWSLFNHNLKIGSDLASYKMPAKDFIFNYDQNHFYHQYKKKFASPFGNKIHFYVLFEDGTKIYDWAGCNKLINQLINA